jgi:glycosyltransferase involved in cell wall biosynthesis
VHDNPFAAVGGRLGVTRLCWGSLRGSTALPGFRSLPPWYRHAALRWVQRVVVNSRALASELDDLGLPPERVLVLPNCVARAEPVAWDDAPRALQELGFAAGTSVFASVGNIRRVKNQALFVRALARVIARRPEARGLVIGETLLGEERVQEELEAEIGRLGLEDKIVLAGFQRDVRRLVRRTAALCLSSDSEGMPNVVLEAMAEGVPVVATAVGGVPEVVRPGNTGQLVPPGDEEALAGAMLRVLDEPAAARVMAAAARDLVAAERGCDAAARRLGDAYLAALNGDRG